MGALRYMSGAGFYYTTIFWCSVVIFILGMVTYYRAIFVPNKEIFSGKSLRDRILSAFSHVDDSHTGPGAHILAGVMSLVGAAGIVATLLLMWLQPETFSVSLILSAFSALTVVFFAAMEIWTLWQTRRIFFSQGYVVNDFRRLIVLLTRELQTLEDSIREDYKGKPQPYHRVYAVAPHFFFGMLSFPLERETRDYENALLNICALRKNCHGAFDIRFICSDENSIHEWHERYYSQHPEKIKKVEEADAKFENLIQQMDQKARRTEEDGSSTIFTRLSDVPKVQFMVIGTKLFEFTLNSENNSTDIYNTQVISDSRQCNAYIEQFKFVSRLSEAPQHRPQPVANGHVLTPDVAQKN